VFRRAVLPGSICTTRLLVHCKGIYVLINNHNKCISFHVWSTSTMYLAAEDPGGDWRRQTDTPRCPHPEQSRAAVERITSGKRMVRSYG
jgi:hypothetical protein